METIPQSEQLTRYILHKSNYSPTIGRVKYNTFMPDKNSETSVYRIASLDTTEIWNIGKNFVSKKRERPLLGRADILTSDVLAVRLNVQPDPKPHPLHANIIGWPEEQSERKLIAIELAANAQLHLINS